MKIEILEEIENYLQPILFKDKKCDLRETLKETSKSEPEKKSKYENKEKDKQSNYNVYYMTESDYLVIQGEKLRDAYSSYKKHDKQLKCVDAIYKFKNGNIYLIEFKAEA